MQVKLLRVLDGTPYYRLGGVRKVSVDVRIVAATNQNLEEAVGQGRFRRDLFHRLSHIDLKVPSLRDRTDDIVPLAEFFLSQQNPRLRLAADAAEKLKRYSWPGNIRELRNVVVKAAVLARDEWIRAQQIPVEPAPCRLARVEDQGVQDLGVIERRMIFQVLEQTGGHQQRAAEVLGISRRTLSRKLKLYDEQGSNYAS